MPIVNDLENIPVLKGTRKMMKVIVPKGSNSKTLAVDTDGALWVISRKLNSFDLTENGTTEDIENVPRLIDVSLASVRKLIKERNEKRIKETFEYELENLRAEADAKGYYLTKKDPR